MEEARETSWCASCSCAAFAAGVAALAGALVAGQLPRGMLVISPGLSAALTGGLVGGAVMFMYLRPWSDGPDEPRGTAEEARRRPPLDP